jgi:hypothetical protein
VIGKIPAPSEEAVCYGVSGLASTGDALFATMACSNGSMIYLLDAETGEVLTSHQWGSEGGLCYPNLSSAAYACPQGGLLQIGEVQIGTFWVTDLTTGEFIGFNWSGGDTIYTYIEWDHHRITTPKGLCYEDYEILWTVDASDDSLYKVDIYGNIQDSYPLPISDPTALTLKGANLLVTSDDFEDKIFEITKAGAIVDTHHVEGLTSALCDFPPLSATYHDGLLYIGSARDSILILEGTYNANVPEGEDVDVPIIPGELTTSFDSVSVEGTLFAEPSQADTCPVPGGVTLYPPFYDMSTTATVHYTFEMEITYDDTLLPPDYDMGQLRIFKRPSGDCGMWRDVTVDSAQLVPVLRRLMRQRSEDDEFSVFAMGLDTRAPKDVVELKIQRLRETIEADSTNIPSDALAELLAKLDEAEEAYAKGNTVRARALADSIAIITRETSGIPNEYSPGGLLLASPTGPGNVAGRIISRARTLAFSLGYSTRMAIMTDAEVVPDRFGLRPRPDWMVAYLDLPDGYALEDIDPDYFYIQYMVQSVPESLSVGDYLPGGGLEIRTVFPYGEVEAIPRGCCSEFLRISGFIGGREMLSNIEIKRLVETSVLLVDGDLSGGSVHAIEFDHPVCSAGSVTDLSYSLDGGATWTLITDEVTGTTYEWLVPDAQTDRAKLRAICSSGDETIAVVSNLFTIDSAAGIGVDAPLGERLLVGPNPTVSSVKIQLASPGGRELTIRVFSVTGELVKTLFAGRPEAGVFTATWDGRNSRGGRVSPGAYFVIVREGTDSDIRKVVLQK